MREPKPTLIYVTDPMCSWCWGFSPVVSMLAARFEDRLGVEVVLGGLRPGTAEPMDARTKATIREHWQHVHDASGQPFDFGFFERERFVYDTEPAARAVVAARRLRADAALPFLARLHAAFYRDNRDVTDGATLIEVAGEFGFDGPAFERELGSDEARRETRGDFARAQALGVRGFPSVLAPVGKGLAAITLGYRPWDAIEPAVEAWLRRNPVA